jgi:hypothetical protein
VSTRLGLLTVDPRAWGTPRPTWWRSDRGRGTLVIVSHEDARRHIGIATQEGQRVHVRVRAEGQGAVGDYIETLTVQAWERAGWPTDRPLADGQTVKILAT